MTGQLQTSEVASLELVMKKWHQLGAEISVAFERVYSGDNLPEVPEEYQTFGMCHEDKRDGMVIQRKLYMPATRAGDTVIFPLGDVPLDTVYANIQFRKSSKPKRRASVAAGRFPSAKRPEPKAFGFSLGGKRISDDYLSIGFPGIDGVFAPLYLKVLPNNETTPKYFKVSAEVRDHQENDGEPESQTKSVWIQWSQVGAGEVPEVLKKVIFRE